MVGFAAGSLGSGDGRPAQKFRGIPHILGPQWAHLPTLTIGLLGVQIFWSVEMGYASPYLLSLGLSKSSVAAVFLAGPLSGLIMQPLIGTLADNSTSRFGRRRPYMLLGTGICVFAMLLLGFTRGVAAIFTGWNNSANDALTIILAVISIYLIDFAINAVQALDRALLVDTLPSSQQSLGNAWAARMLGFGAVVGFFVGTIPLPTLFPFLGKTQLQVLSVIVSLLLLGGHVLMALCVKERILLKSEDESSGQKHGSRSSNAFIREVRDLWTNMLTLPSVIRQICIIQFFVWIAWFPLLFYTTIYVGDLYKRANPLSSRDAPFDSQTLRQRALARNAEATRLGSRALFYSAVLALIINWVMPAFVATPVSKRSLSSREYRSRNASVVGEPLGGLGEEIGSARVGSAGLEDETRQRRRWLHHREDQGWEVLGMRFKLKIPESMKINLATLWAVSHLVLGLCMLGTLFTDSVTGATFLIGVTGFSWAITQWAPFSLLGEAILTEPDPAAGEPIQLSDSRTPIHESEQEGFLEHSDSDNDDERDDRRGSNGVDVEVNGVMGSNLARLSRPDLHQGHEDEWEEDDGVSDPETGQGGLSAKAGIILGIHNIFIVIPQFLVTGLSAIIFAVFDPVQSHAGVLPSHPPPPASVNGTTPVQVANVTMRTVGATVRELAKYAENEDSVTEAQNYDNDGKSNSVVYVLRLGGVAALVAFVLGWRLAREMRHR